jgi:predicted HTH transcriptional regulator
VANPKARDVGKHARLQILVPRAVRATCLVGVDDAGHFEGPDLDLEEKRHARERRVRQLARTRIKPVPPVQVVFEEIRGMTVGRISVARGEAPLYMLDDVACLRRRSSDVQAQLDEIIPPVTQFAY